MRRIKGQKLLAMIISSITINITIAQSYCHSSKVRYAMLTAPTTLALNTSKMIRWKSKCSLA